MMQDATLHTLAASGNIKIIRLALENPDLFYETDEERGWSPLHYASNYSKHKVVDLILGSGVSPNIESIPINKDQGVEWSFVFSKIVLLLFLQTVLYPFFCIDCITSCFQS